MNFDHERHSCATRCAPSTPRPRSASTSPQPPVAAGVARVRAARQTYERSLRRGPLLARTTVRHCRKGRRGEPRVRQPDRGRRCARARSSSTSDRAAASTCCSRPGASVPTGKAYGLDMTDEMLELARGNAAGSRATNVEFLKGYIEEFAPRLVRRRRHLELRRSTSRQTSRPCWARCSGCSVRAAGSGSPTSSPRTRLTPRQRAERGSYVGCIAGALSRDEYQSAGRRWFRRTSDVTFTHDVADGMHGAVVQGATPGFVSSLRSGSMASDEWVDLRCARPGAGRSSNSPTSTSLRATRRRRRTC